MHYLTVIGLFVIAIRTAMTIKGHNIKSNSELMSTINQMKKSHLFRLRLNCYVRMMR